MFTIIILETPQRNVTLPLLPEDSERVTEPVERLRVTVNQITERQMKLISKIAWKFPRKARKDKGIPRKQKETLISGPLAMNQQGELVKAEDVTQGSLVEMLQ